MKRAAALAGASAAVLSAALAAAPVSVVDDGGTRIVLAQPARRVISLSPALTELAFAAGAGERLVGIDTASDYPPAATRSLQRIGDAAGIDLERIIALRPDLILAWLSGNKATDVARLRQLSIPVFLSEPRTLDDVPHSLRVMARCSEVKALPMRRRLRSNAELWRCVPGTRAYARCRCSSRSGINRS